MSAIGLHDLLTAIAIATLNVPFGCSQGACWLGLMQRELIDRRVFSESNLVQLLTDIGIHFVGCFQEVSTEHVLLDTFLRSPPSFLNVINTYA